MKRIWLCIPIFVILLQLSSFIVHAEDHLVNLDEKTEKINISTSIDILEDKCKQWTLDDILSKELEDSFRRNDTINPNLGYTSSAYWVRFTVNNKTNHHEWILEIDNPTMDYVTLYE